ncbi:MAG TPA: hypothetical protein VGB26_00070 [Nitrospiria bacterium]
MKKTLFLFYQKRNKVSQSFLILVFFFFSLVPYSLAGNPFLPRSNGNPYLWDTSNPLPFHPDGGNLGLWNNTTAVANTLEAFDRWGPDISTSSLTFSNAGGIPGDGDVNTVAEFNALDGNCADNISPVIFDANGSLFSALGLPSGVIAFAGPDCGIDATGEITEGIAVINGKWFDGNPTNGELTEDDFKGTLVHEFGHWLNLDHSQVNGHYFLGDSDVGFDEFATGFGPPPLSSVEIMFPLIFSGAASTPRIDDVATVSRMYPSGGFGASTGTITGTIYLPNGVTPFQGADVIARNVVDPYNDAVSNVSGDLFSAPASVGFYEIPGLTAGGNYSLEISNVNPQFTAGSSVGELDPPATIPGPEEFFNGVNEASTNPPDDVTIYTSLGSSAGVINSGANVIINGLSADLSVIKTDSPDPVLAGTQLTYTVTVTNNGPDNGTNVILTDTLTPGLTFISATPSQGSCSETGGVVTCPLGNLANGLSATVTIVGIPTTDGSITNTATVSGNEGDPNSGNNSVSEITTVNPASSDLSIIKTDSPDPVLVGQNLVYTLTATNNGPSIANGITVTDTLDSSVTFLSATPTQGSCFESGGTVTCSLGTLSNGSGAAITILVQPTLEGSISNSASVTANENDPNGTNNSDSEITNVKAASSDLSLTKIDTPDPVSVGATLTYNINVINNGPSLANGVTVTDSLPGGVSFGSAVPSQGICSENSGTVTCNLGTLSDGASATVNIFVTPSLEGTLSNSANVMGNEADPNISDNSATETTTVSLDPGLLSNISTRGLVLTGANVMIGGFIIEGTSSKTVLIRAQGPSLVDFGVTGAMANPTMQLFSGSTSIAQNNDWQTTDPLCASPAVSCGGSAEIIATGLDPCTAATTGCNLDSAIYITLPPGAYTAIVSGVGGGTGVGLVGVFDVDTGNTLAQLINISTRGFVGTGANVQIAGFIIEGTSSKTVLIRAQGPSLVDFGVTGAMANPTMQVFSGSTVIAQNNNWQTTDPLCSAPAVSCGDDQDINATGLDPCSAAITGCALDSAIYITLPPGAYTAIVSGVGGGTGVGLVGLFDVN